MRISDWSSDVCSSDLLALALGAYVYFFKGNFGRLRELTAAKSPGWRRRRYRIWIAKAFVLFAGPALLGLALLGRLDALAVLPGEFGRLAVAAGYPLPIGWRSEEHTSELQSLMRISYAVFCLKKKT